MPFTAKSAAPLVAHVPIPLAALEQAADDHMTVFTAPPGYLPAGALAATLSRRQRTTLWLRLGPEDRDAGTLLISLVAAMQRIRPGAGAFGNAAIRINTPVFDNLGTWKHEGA